MPGRPKMTMVERALDKFSANSDEECWNWTGYKDRDGYGMIRRPGRNGDVKAHRFIYSVVNGPISGVIMHKCDNRSCVNPSHLLDGSQNENIADMIAKGRARSFGRKSGRVARKEDDNG